MRNRLTLSLYSRYVVLQDAEVQKPLIWVFGRRCLLERVTAALLRH